VKIKTLQKTIDHDRFACTCTTGLVGAGTRGAAFAVDCFLGVLGTVAVALVAPAVVAGMLTVTPLVCSRPMVFV
jgi:hypothetical protein